MNITPEIYARWRESALGTLTERLEQRAIFSLAGDPSGLRVLDMLGTDVTCPRIPSDGASRAAQHIVEIMQRRSQG